jgi:hypothetical protein
MIERLKEGATLDANPWRVNNVLPAGLETRRQSNNAMQKFYEVERSAVDILGATGRAIFLGSAG